MTIRIAERLHPLSHLPGTCCLLPLTQLKLQIFPTRINFFECGHTSVLFSLFLEIEGPVKNFTVELDLEHQLVRVFGMTPKGYLRYILQPQADGIGVVFDKLPQGSLKLTHHQTTHTLSKNEKLLLPHVFKEPVQTHNSERLSLGMHKSQDWDLVKRRLDLKEIFPIWMRLGQITPSSTRPHVRKGNLILLERCRELIEEKRKLDIVDAFTLLFLAGFEGIAVPRLYDMDFQGIAPLQHPENSDPCPVHILTQGAELIRSMFLKEEKGTLFVLPCLPPDFHAGRILEARTHAGDRLGLEWSKKQVKRLAIFPHAEKSMHIAFESHLRKCRIRNSAKDRGKVHTLDSGELNLELKANRPIFIDCFQK